MSRNYSHPGKVLTVTATTEVASGSFQTVGKIFGIATTAAKVGKQYELATGDVWELPKVPGTAWAMGDDVYYDATAKAFTKTVGSNLRVGVASQAAAAGAALALVRLNNNF